MPLPVMKAIGGGTKVSTSRCFLSSFFFFDRDFDEDIFRLRTCPVVRSILTWRTVLKLKKKRRKVKNILYNRAIQITATRRGVSTCAFPRSEIVFCRRATRRLFICATWNWINRSMYYVWYIWCVCLSVCAFSFAKIL